MEALSTAYNEKLKNISSTIQHSDILAAYLEEEEDDQYKALVEAFEPSIHELYGTVAKNDPLQIEAFEHELLDPDFEGLYIPRLIGYNVLRGAVNNQCKYFRPAHSLVKVLNAMAQNNNFDQIRQRTGQTIQLGFALSSDISVTNFINALSSKRTRTYFEELKNPALRKLENRQAAYNSLKKQFDSHTYITSEFPTDEQSLKTLYPQVKHLIISRIGKPDLNNESIIAKMSDLLSNKDFQGNPEYLSLIALFINFYDTSAIQKTVSDSLNAVRVSQPDFVDRYFDYLERIYTHDLPINAESDQRVLDLLDTSIADDMTSFYQLMHTIHSKGYIHDDTIEQVKNFYETHDGTSKVNECLRLAILSYFDKVLTHLSVEDYQEYFELNKIFVVYINIFANQEFNQHVKYSSLKYINKLKKRYTDKRGKDYQDIKKFVKSTFTDLGFMTEKKLVEFFKTKRKKKPVEA